jgi:hypothetical protein
MLPDTERLTAIESDRVIPSTVLTVHLDKSGSHRIVWLLEKLGAPYAIERYARVGRRRPLKRMAGTEVAPHLSYIVQGATRVSVRAGKGSRAISRTVQDP